MIQVDVLMYAAGHVRQRFAHAMRVGHGVEEVTSDHIEEIEGAIGGGVQHIAAAHSF